MDDMTALVVLAISALGIAAALGGAVGYLIGQRRASNVCVQIDADLLAAMLKARNLEVVPRGVEWSARRKES